MTYWDELEVKSRELFERTASGMGFSRPVPWDELAEDTRDMYRRELVRRLPDNGTGDRND